MTDPAPTLRQTPPPVEKKKKGPLVPCCLAAFAMFLIVGIALAIGAGMLGKKAVEHAKVEEARKNREIPGYASFKSMDDSLGKAGAPPGAGNMPEAEQLAKEFYRQFKAACEQTLGSVEAIDGTGSQFGGPGFVTYCQIQPEAVAFIANSPRTGETPSAEQTSQLIKLAWQTANEVLQTRATPPAPGTRLMVALRGGIFYDVVIEGQPDALVGGPGSGLEQSSEGLSNKELLYPYFAPPAPAQ